MALVIALHCVPPMLKVTCSFGIDWLVYVLIKVPDSGVEPSYTPLLGSTFNWVPSGRLTVEAALAIR